MKRLIIFTIIIGLILCGTAYGRTYKIGIVAWAGWSPVNVADVKGFWKEQGIDVKVYTLSTPQEVLGLFENRRIDLAWEMIGSIVEFYIKGMPVKILAETDWSHGGDKIIIKKDMDIATFKEKPIGIYYDAPSVTFFLNQYLSTIGIKLSDTRIIVMEPNTLADHFISDRFGSIVCFDPEAIRAEREGKGKVIATTATYEGCMPEGIMVMEDILNKIPHEDLVKIFKGWIKAVKWTSDPFNWKEYMEILNNYTFKKMPPYSEKDLKEIVNAVRIHNVEMQIQRNRDFGGLHTYLNDLKVFLSSNNLLKKDFTPKAIFNNKAIMEALTNP